MKFKRLGRYIACLLLCAMTCGILVNPAFAVTTGEAAETPVQGAEITAPVLEDPVEKSKGHCVSKVHYSASYGSTDIGSFENGTKITVLGTKGDFYKVDCFEMDGYIAKSQVKEVNGEYYVNCVEGSGETKYLPAFSAQKALTLRSNILTEAKKHLGVPYLRGGVTPRGFDCSGYAMYVFQQAGFDLHRSLYVQMASGIIVAKEDLQSGDLIIFSNTTGYGHFASHIGIYIGNGQVIHASCGGITIDDLSSDYYTRYYQCSRRIILTELAPSVTMPTIGTSDWRN